MVSVNEVRETKYIAVWLWCEHRNYCQRQGKKREIEEERGRETQGDRDKSLRRQL